MSKVREAICEKYGCLDSDIVGLKDHGDGLHQVTFAWGRSERFHLAPEPKKPVKKKAKAAKKKG